MLFLKCLIIVSLREEFSALRWFCPANHSVVWGPCFDKTICHCQSEMQGSCCREGERERELPPSLEVQLTAQSSRSMALGALTNTNRQRETLCFSNTCRPRPSITHTHFLFICLSSSIQREWRCLLGLNKVETKREKLEGIWKNNEAIGDSQP